MKTMAPLLGSLLVSCGRYTALRTTGGGIRHRLSTIATAARGGSQSSAALSSLSSLPPSSAFSRRGASSSLSRRHLSRPFLLLAATTTGLALSDCNRTSMASDDNQDDNNNDNQKNTRDDSPHEFPEDVVEMDNYNGVILRMARAEGKNSTITTTDGFRSLLQSSLQAWETEGKRGIWVYLPTKLAHLVPVRPFNPCCCFLHAYVRFGSCPESCICPTPFLYRLLDSVKECNAHLPDIFPTHIPSRLSLSLFLYACVCVCRSTNVSACTILNVSTDLRRKWF